MVEPRKLTAKTGKAVGLFSGGLDSCVSAALMRRQGYDVTVIFFAMPWVCEEIKRVEQLTEQLGVGLKIVPLGDDYLSMLKSPRFGYGSSFNPCLDCHIFMIQKAEEYRRETGADFVFTGEVVGQRPMSQRWDCMGTIEEATGLTGWLLRPLSAKLLEPTVPEKEGWVDRQQLQGISGRGRKDQLALAQAFGIEGFSTPSGGCLLTEEHFGRRLKDCLTQGGSSMKGLAVLRWGRYLRLTGGGFVMLGRDEKENELLRRYANPDDYLLEMRDVSGPLGLLRCRQGGAQNLAIAAGLVQWFSKSRNDPARLVFVWPAGFSEQEERIEAVKLAQSDVTSMTV